MRRSLFNISQVRCFHRNNSSYHFGFRLQSGSLSHIGDRKSLQRSGPPDVDIRLVSQRGHTSPVQSTEIYPLQAQRIGTPITLARRLSERPCVCLQVTDNALHTRVVMYVLRFRPFQCSQLSLRRFLAT